MKKRMLSFFICAVFCLSIAACGAPKQQATITVSDKSFSCTPNELISLLNEAVIQTDPDDLLSVPDFTSSDDEIIIGGTGLTLSLSTAPSDKLSSIELYWYSGADSRPENIESAAFYVGIIFNAMLPEYANDINAKMVETMETDSNEMDYTKNNISVHYRTYGLGANKLTITPT